jgi:hypothetical protein
VRHGAQHDRALGRIFQFAHLADAEAFLIAAGFKPTGIADWTNDAGADAGIYPVEGCYGAIRAFRVEINLAIIDDGASI